MVLTKDEERLLAAISASCEDDPEQTSILTVVQAYKCLIEAAALREGTTIAHPVKYPELRHAPYHEQLSVRSGNCMRRLLQDKPLITLDDITVDVLDDIRNCGQTTKAEVMAWLSKYTEGITK